VKTLIPLFIAAVTFTTAAADVIVFDPDGPGGANAPQRISGFVFGPGNMLADDALPFTTGASFQLYQQMSVEALLDADGHPFVPVGLNTSFEITVVTSVKYGVQSVSASGPTKTVTAGGWFPQPDSSYVEVWFDRTPEANALTGTGYNDGTLILRAAPEGFFTSATFMEERNADGSSKFSAFDQFGTDNYPGLLTIRCSGDLTASAKVVARDANYFLSKIRNISIETDTVATPFTQTNPSSAFVSIAGGQYPSLVPELGYANGFDGKDFQMQTTATASATNQRPYVVVNKTGDYNDGACNGNDCTLREAILGANSAGDINIHFAPGLTGTIQLIAELPPLSADVEIDGPGADQLTVRRDTGGNYRIFTVGNGTTIGPSVSIRGLTIANGQGTGSPANGGGIYNDHGALVIEKCTITGNKATNAAGVYAVGGITTVLDSTISDNVANSFGGAFFNSALQANATLNITNSTLGANSASRGAAIYNASPSGVATVTLQNATLSGNTSSLATVYEDGSSSNIILRNSILSSGAASANIVLSNGATVSSGGNNLSSDAVGGDSGTSPGGLLNQPGDKRNTDPKFDSAGLEQNGGTTPTIALRSDSPAINAGKDATAPSNDQRNFNRNGASDIGAFEFGGKPSGIASITRLPNGHIYLQCFGAPKQVNILEASPDLSRGSFAPINPPPASADAAGAFHYDDANAASLTKRFYRLTLP
jgi:CSLREA domain-containing protein